MDALWTSGVAVLGTLLGSATTYGFQRLADERGRRFARSEAVRQERMAAFSAFAAAVEDYRRGQADRWFRHAEDPEGAAFLAARAEVHVLRTAARQALYRVKLLTEDPGVVRAAEEAYRCVVDLSNAPDRADREVRDGRAKEALEGFVLGASPLVR